MFRRGIELIGKIWLKALAMLGICMHAPTIAPANSIVLDKVWSGSPTGFAGIWRDGLFFVAYYNAQRKIAVQKLDGRGNPLEEVVLEETFAGWDAHNALEIELDGHNRLHLAGNMHASSLVYFRGALPYSVKSLSRIDRMVGKDEARVTYPRFLRLDDYLYFFYRSGGSGNGKWLLNRWDGTSWSRDRPGVLFADRDAVGPVSAYPSRFVPDGQGGMGVAYVWRRGPDASLNVRMCFARTRDFKTWTTIDGSLLSVPLGTDCPMPVEDTGPGRGLNNNQSLFFGANAVPIIIYHKLDAHHHNQVYMATIRSGAWHQVALTDWTEHFDFAGAGSLPLPFSIGVLQDDARDRIVVTARHERFPPTEFYIDRTTLAVIRAPLLGRVHPASMISAVENRQTNSLRITDERGRERGLLIWATLKANRDRPPTCAGPSQQNCLPPPSELYFHIMAAPKSPSR